MRIESDPTYHQQLPQIQRDQVQSPDRTQAAAAYEQTDIQKVQREDDQVTLSSKAQELRRLHEVVEELPDVRARVEEIRKAVADGSYQIPEDQLIDRLTGIR